MTENPTQDILSLTTHANGSSTGAGVPLASFDHRKYRPYEPLDLPDRQWPQRRIMRAPLWCAVDLRDGNQALMQPMSVAQKVEMFQLLVSIGFKHIEIGFPSAAQPEYDFTRLLIEQQLIPDDVTIQVLTQAREHLIARTFEALAGVKRAIVHVYNSTSTVQREQVFEMSQAETQGIAVQGAAWVEAYARQYPETQWTFEYSPESFTGTEIDFALSVCNAVIQEWNPKEKGWGVIVNLPATVEMSTPNVFADQVEYLSRHLHQREHVMLSVHTHNDRACAVAATELALLAGADRVEGTLFGNGERTGNADIIALAMNLYSQGIDPHLNFSQMPRILEVYQRCTALPVHPRHPWVGELVYTAFSGGHQDAIRKSLRYHESHALEQWNVAYLPIDPADLGRCYESVVRINSQSGKGGVAHVLERHYGVTLPKWLHSSIAHWVQLETERTGTEIDAEAIVAIFKRHYVAHQVRFHLCAYTLSAGMNDSTVGVFELASMGQDRCLLRGQGNGPIDALVNALHNEHDLVVQVLHFEECALSSGAEASAMACVSVQVEWPSGVRAQREACAIAADSTQASLQAVLTAVDQAFEVCGEDKSSTVIVPS